MASPFTDAVATLSDRALRRLLGARAFLRGCDYVRRRAVTDVTVDDAGARAVVRGTGQTPYEVRVALAPHGISSQCSCPTFSKVEGHCKHVAALLIALREQTRGPRAAGGAEGSRGDGFSRDFGPDRGARGPSPSNGGYANGEPQASQSSHSSSGGHSAHSAHSASHSTSATMQSGGVGAHGEPLSRRVRRGGRRGGAGGGGGSGGSGFANAPAARDQAHGVPQRAPGGVGGLDAWLPDDGVQANYPDLEFRITVKASMAVLHVVAIDPIARVAVSPSEAFVAQSACPTGDREALRVLARLERGDGRRGLEVRGEDAAELVAKLRGRRVLLEPQLAQLRWSDETLRVRFDLELAKRPSFSGAPEPDGRVVVKASFERFDRSGERKGDGRRLLLSTGAWFEGAPGYHVDTNEGIARAIDPRVTPAWLQRLWRAPQITHPLTDLPVLLSDKLPRIASEIGAELPSLGEVAEEIELPPNFKLRAFGELIEARVQLAAAYGETEIEVRADGMSPPILVLPPAGPGKKPRCVRANVLEQQQAVEAIRALGFVPDEEGKGLVCRGDDAIGFWTEGLGQLPEEWEFFVPDDLVGVQVRSDQVGARARVSSGVDWLSLKVTFQVQGVTVPPDELARCLSEGRRYVKLEDGSYARIDASKVRDVLARQAEILAGSKSGKISLAQAGRVQELLGHVASAQVTGDAKQLFDKLQKIDDIETVKKPRNLKATLRPYQESGLAWLAFVHELGSGGVLADDMGLGKTLETIALLLHLKNERKKKEGDESPRANLIVCPTSVVPNWLAEVEKFAPSLKAIAWHGADRHELAGELEENDIIVTSYALLRRDEEQLSKLKLSYAILDEAQHIKNPLSATARAAKKLNAQRRLALTGTPIENRLSEIWSIFDFVSPGLLGELNRFEQRYATPIDRGDSKAAARLRAAIHPFVLRRTKEEVAKDLPEKIEIEQGVEMAAEQSKLYQQVLAEVRASVLGEVDRVGFAKAQIQILAALTRLRQVACDPRLIGLPRAFSDDDSGKLGALRELVAEAFEGGHRVIVFSQFVSMLTLIRKAFEEDGVKYEYLDGSTKDRAERISRFQNDPTVTCFLISLKAGGTGLNLTGADTVVHFDPWWNPAVEDQATARAHRIGQTKVVTAYKLVAKGTIEEKILQLAEKKRALVESVLSEDVGGAKKLTRQDLDELFAG